MICEQRQNEKKNISNNEMNVEHTVYIKCMHFIYREPSICKFNWNWK